MIKLREDITNDEVKCDKVIVIMNTEEDKGDVIKDFEKGKKKGKDYSEYFTTEEPDA